MCIRCNCKNKPKYFDISNIFAPSFKLQFVKYFTSIDFEEWLLCSLLNAFGLYIKILHFVLHFLFYKEIKDTDFQSKLMKTFFRKKAESVVMPHPAPAGTAVLAAATTILAAVHPVQAAARQRPATAEPLSSPCTTMARVCTPALSLAPWTQPCRTPTASLNVISQLLFIFLMICCVPSIRRTVAVAPPLTTGAVGTTGVIMAASGQHTQVAAQDTAATIIMPDILTTTPLTARNQLIRLNGS